MLPTKIQVNWSFGSGEAKNRFSRWQPWGSSWISDRNNISYFFIYTSSRCFLPCLILAIFDLQVTWILLPRFKSVGLLAQEKKRKIDFQDGRHGGHLGFPIGTILAIFDLQVTPMFPTKFQDNWPFGSEEEKTIFKMAAISHLDASYQVLSQLAQRCRSMLLKQIVDAARRTRDNRN